MPVPPLPSPSLAPLPSQSTGLFSNIGCTHVRRRRRTGQDTSPRHGAPLDNGTAHRPPPRPHVFLCSVGSLHCPVATAPTNVRAPDGEINEDYPIFNSGGVYFVCVRVRA